MYNVNYYWKTVKPSITKYLKFRSATSNMRFHMKNKYVHLLYVYIFKEGEMWKNPDRTKDDWKQFSVICKSQGEE